MSEDHSRETPHPAWELAFRVGAPLTVGIGGTCYVAGSIYRGTIFRAAGLGPGLTTPSLQDILAVGYWTLWSSATRNFLAVVATVIPSLVYIAFVYTRRKKSSSITMVDNAGALLQLIGLILLALISGIIAGFDTATRDITRVDAALRSNCTMNCKAYHTKNGTVWGVAIAVDKDRVVVAGRRGTQIIPISSLYRVSWPHNRSFSAPEMITPL